MTNSSKVLNRILKSNCCTGCGLCAAVSKNAIEMHMSTAGFLRPRQKGPIAPNTDQLISDICPGITLNMKADGPGSHVLWGPVVEVRTGASSNAELHHHASSGGVLSALILYLLEGGIVDYVVQIKASSDMPIENTTTESTVYGDVYAAAGSRYAPSAPLEKLDQYLERPGRFALVGKPCDIAAARSLARHDRRIDEKIPVMLSFFCAGVPSIKGTREILTQMNVDEKDVKTFQYRGDGWPGFAKATLKDGSQTQMDYASSWGNILSHHVQFRCKICPDGSGGFADIVCADAWHCDEKGYPLFDDRQGRSLIISRTKAGEDLLQQAMASHYLTASLLDVAEIQKMQPSQAQRKRLVFARMAALAISGRPTPEFRGFNLIKAARAAGIWPNVKNFLGMARRLFASKQ